MASCDSCGSTILFGGVRCGEMRYCNYDCQIQMMIQDVGQHMSNELVLAHTRRIHQGLCPQCHGPGPVDLYSANYVASMFVVTTRRTQQKICYRGCGAKMQIGGLVFSSLVGWWGIPFGLILTPVQIFRNLVGLLNPPDPSKPSGCFCDFTRHRLAELVLADTEGVAAGEMAELIRPS